MTKTVTLENAGPEHALLVIGSLATTGAGVIDPSQAMEFRRTMEEKGLMHVPETEVVSQGQAMLSAKETMQRTGYTLANADTAHKSSVAKVAGKEVVKTL